LILSCAAGGTTEALYFWRNNGPHAFLSTNLIVPMRFQQFACKLLINGVFAKRHVCESIGHLAKNIGMFIGFEVISDIKKKLYLSSCAYVDDEHWQNGFDDSLQTRSGVHQ
jgi:hypothetical protein